MTELTAEQRKRIQEIAEQWRKGKITTEEYHEKLTSFYPA